VRDGHRQSMSCQSMSFGGQSGAGLACVCVLVWYAMGTTGLAGPPLPSGAGLPAPSAVPGEVLVLLSADVNDNRGLDGAESAIPGQVVQRMALSKRQTVLRVKLPGGQNAAAAVAANWRQADARIVAVEPNYIVHSAATPNDPRFPEQWSLNNLSQTGGTTDADIDAPEAWDLTTGSSSVLVAVIDTGVDFLHPDLVDNMWVNAGEIPDNDIDDDLNGYVDDVYGYDFYQDDSDPSDPNGHGTHVAGIAAARGNDATGTTGVSWSAQVMACRFLDAKGNGTVADAIEAINYAVANGAHILNNSWGGYGYSAGLQAAVINARDQGVLCVAAAGNSSADIDLYPYYPAAFNIANVIAVASTTSTDNMSPFSNFGPATVHLGAPGSDILSTVPSPTSLFFEDFQAASVPGFVGAQMTEQGPANRWGTVQNDVGFPGNIAASGDYANAQPYLGDSDGSIVTPVMDTRGLRGLIVRFDIRIDAGVDDVLIVDIWDATSWVTIDAISATHLFLPDLYYSVLIEVPEHLRSAAAQFRWRWVTDDLDNQRIGVEIDNLDVRYHGSDYTDAYALVEGTSMATPHVTGAAALLLADDPGMSLTDLKQRLIVTGDPAPALATRTASGRRLNVHNALTATYGVTVMAANGGESWALGSVQNILWVSLGGADTVDIDLLQNGIVHSRIADDVANVGNFIWTVPDTLTVGANYRIQVSDGIDTDTSDGDFTVFEATEFYTEHFSGGSHSFDLAGHAVLFVPDAISDYTPCVSSISSLPTDPTGGTQLTLGDEDFIAINLSGGQTIPLFGDTFGAFFVGSNGYVTFDSGDTTSDDILQFHFDRPRISALFTDLDPTFPGVSGTISWRQLPDRAVVTWDGISSWYAMNSNTFQVEMFFDGRIRLSWLGIDVVGALVGLSDGNGLPSNFQESDFLAYAGCGGSPVAQPIVTETLVDTAVDIDLIATDPDGDPMTFRITSLPSSGTLSDPAGGLITTIPYPLAGGGNVVRYQPGPAFIGNDSFRFHADDGGAPPDGGPSADATVDVATHLPTPELLTLCDGLGALGDPHAFISPMSANHVFDNFDIQLNESVALVGFGITASGGIAPGSLTLNAAGPPGAYVVQLNGGIPRKAWTTITITVRNASGITADLCVRLAHLPCDNDRNGVVALADVTAFVNEFQGLQRVKLADINGDGAVGLADISDWVNNLVGRAGLPPAQDTTLPLMPTCP